MHISNKMNPWELAERMGRDANISEAMRMRSVLVNYGMTGLYTEDISQDAWLSMLNEVIEAA